MPLTSCSSTNLKCAQRLHTPSVDLIVPTKPGEHWLGLGLIVRVRVRVRVGVSVGVGVRVRVRVGARVRVG